MSEWLKGYSGGLGAANTPEARRGAAMRRHEDAMVEASKPHATHQNHVAQSADAGAFMQGLLILGVLVALGFMGKSLLGYFHNPALTWSNVAIVAAVLFSTAVMSRHYQLGVLTVITLFTYFYFEDAHSVILNGVILINLVAAFLVPVQVSSFYSGQLYYRVFGQKEPGINHWAHQWAALFFLVYAAWLLGFGYFSSYVVGAEDRFISPFVVNAALMAAFVFAIICFLPIRFSRMAKDVIASSWLTFGEHNAIIYIFGMAVGLFVGILSLFTADDWANLHRLIDFYLGGTQGSYAPETTGPASQGFTRSVLPERWWYGYLIPAFASFLCLPLFQNLGQKTQKWLLITGVGLYGLFALYAVLLLLALYVFSG